MAKDIVKDSQKVAGLKPDHRFMVGDPDTGELLYAEPSQLPVGEVSEEQINQALDSQKNVPGGVSTTDYIGINPNKTFNAIGNGIVDDTDAFQAAINYGAPIYLQKGSVYRFTKAFDVVDKDVRIINQGAKFLSDGINSEYLFNVRVTNSQKFNVTQIVEAGDYTQITFNGVIGDLQKGDVLKIFSSDVSIAPMTANGVQTSYRGEFLTINDFNVSGGVTTVVVYKDLDFVYSTNIRIAKIKKHTFVADSVEVYNNSSSRAIGFAHLYGVYNPIITNPKVDRTDWPFLTIRGCYRPTIFNPVVNYVADAIDGNSSTPNAIGYGINADANFGLQVIGGNLSNLRHAYTTGGGVTDIDDYTLFGEENTASLFGVTASRCQAAFDTHEQGYNIHFLNCIADHCGIGSQTRARGIVIDNLTTKDTAVGVSARNGFGFDATSKEGVYINNLTMLGKAVTSIKTVKTASKKQNYIRINGCNLISTPIIYEADCKINDVNIELTSSDTAWMITQASNVYTYGIKVSGNPAAMNGVVIEESATPCTVVTENTEINIQTPTAVYVARATEGQKNKVGIFKNTKYLGKSPTTNTIGVSPITGASAFTVLKYSFKKESLNEDSYAEVFTGRLICRPDVNSVFPLGNSVIMDDVIMIRLSNSSGIGTINEIKKGTHPGQQIILINATNFRIDLNVSDLIGDKTASMLPGDTINLSYDGISWRTQNYNFDRLTNRPNTLSGYGINDAFQYRGTVGSNDNILTSVPNGWALRGSDIGNTVARGYPYENCPGGRMAHYYMNSTNSFYEYTTNINTSYRCFKNAGVYTPWERVGVNGVPDGRSTPYTKAELNAKYPTARVSFTVVCKTLNSIYYKEDDSPNGDWGVVNATQVS